MLYVFKRNVCLPGRPVGTTTAGTAAKSSPRRTVLCLKVTSDNSMHRNKKRRNRLHSTGSPLCVIDSCCGCATSAKGVVCSSLWQRHQCQGRSSNSSEPSAFCPLCQAMPTTPSMPTAPRRDSCRCSKRRWSRRQTPSFSRCRGHLQLDLEPVRPSAIHAELHRRVSFLPAPCSFDSVSRPGTYDAGRNSRFRVYWRAVVTGSASCAAAGCALPQGRERHPGAILRWEGPCTHLPCISDGQRRSLHRRCPDIAQCTAVQHPQAHPETRKISVQQAWQQSECDPLSTRWPVARSFSRRILLRAHPAAWPNLVDVRLSRDQEGQSKGFAFLVRSCLSPLPCLPRNSARCVSLPAAGRLRIALLVVFLRLCSWSKHARGCFSSRRAILLDFASDLKQYTVVTSKDSQPKTCCIIKHQVR